MRFSSPHDLIDHHACRPIISRVYAKVEVDGRADLAAQVARRDL